MSFTKVSIFSVATTMLLASSATSAFAPQLPSSQLMKPPASVTSMTGPLFLAGFGSSKSNGKGKAKGKSKSTDGKLKPKQQWDRYLDMKRSQKKAVAVRIEGTEEWIEVGKVKSNEDMYTELAVARQRALIAEHAKRLFPLKISNKNLLEWGYQNNENDEWVLVKKSVLDGDIPADLEKIIGFEGTPDPATGFYCVYDGGQIKAS